MKKLVLTLGIVLAGLNFAFSQEKNDAPSLFNKINQVCQLSDEQKGKLQPAVFQYVQAQKDNQTQYAGNPDGLNAANLTARHNFEDKLKTILTVVQMDTYTSNMTGQNADLKK